MVGLTRRRVGLAAAAVAALLATGCAGRSSDETTSTTGSTTTSSTVAAIHRCETVGFTPNSEDAASEITATSLGCDEAEAFVRIAGSRTSSGGPEQVEVEGYQCVRTRSEQEPLPRSFYECKNGAKTVTFVRS